MLSNKNNKAVHCNLGAYARSSLSLASSMAVITANYASAQPADTGAPAPINATTTVGGGCNATNANVTGTSNATNANVTGTSNATNANVTGTSNATNANVTGTSNATNANVTGTSNATNANVTGTSNATNANVTGTCNPTNATTTGDAGTPAGNQTVGGPLALYGGGGGQYSCNI